MRLFPPTTICFTIKNHIGNPLKSQHKRIVRAERIRKIMEAVRERHGLNSPLPPIHYLIGRKQEGVERSGRGHSSQLDIGHKTKLILQSSHPVRYIIEREIHELGQSNPKDKLNHHDWVTLFGRSILPEDQFRSQSNSALDAIANAVAAGIFSSDVHHTIMNVPEELKGSAADEIDLNLGNKYAVLVGDYFAIKVIYFAEQAKSSQVMLAITQGVEEFTSAGFSSKIIDNVVWNWVTPLPNVTLAQWEEYSKMASGYFNGGCYAVLKLMQNKDVLPSDIVKFVDNSALFLKALKDIDDFENEEPLTSPFLLMSLPGILYQQRRPTAYDVFRRDSKDRSVTLELNQIRFEISRSTVLQEAKEQIQKYAINIKTQISHIATSEFYSSTVSELLDAMIDA